MEQKAKFIIIGLAGFCLVCLFLFIQSVGQQQKLQREASDLKTENTTLVNKANKLESDLRENQGRINALTAERDRGIEELNTLQKKLDAAAAARDELIEKLKERSRQQLSQPVAAPVETPAAPVFSGTSGNDAYWATVLKAKNELEMRLNETQTQLRNLQQINQELRNEKKRTEAEIHLESQLSDVRLELKNLQIANESLRREKGILEMDINNLRNEKKDMQRQLDYNQKLLDGMSQEVVRERNDKLNITETFKNTKASNTVLLRQVKSLTSRKLALDKKVAELTQDKKALERRLGDTEKAMSGKSSTITALKSELATLRDSDEPAPAKDGSVQLPAIVVHPGTASSGATQKATVQVNEFPGKILAVNLESNFVVIDSGSSSGVRVGDVFNVSRAGQVIGNIAAIQTRDAISACDIKRMTTPLKIGDQIQKK